MSPMHPIFRYINADLYHMAELIPYFGQSIESANGILEIVTNHYICMYIIEVDVSTSVAILTVL